MVDKNSEMSLDEVLMSIKKMVVAEEPPVLDLTDMVKPDGSIEKIRTPDSGGSDMGTFLKLVQENTDSAYEKKMSKDEYKASIVSTDVFSSLGSSFGENRIMKETSVSLINKWIDNNLQSVAEKVIEEKIREWFKKHPIE